jgi:predicted small secreted protein
MEHSPFFQALGVNQIVIGALLSRASHCRYILEIAHDGPGRGRAPAYTFHAESTVMKTHTKIATALLAVMLLASCGNTIRGAGRDTSNAVDATKDAANDVAN